ncbi:MAG TPA: DUF2191 domain-containing protein [Nocardioidaceae bacterium]|nr:DUF2191 domain-containing protein [Nocardioidaceae bacterium]
MRTTLNLDERVLAAARSKARHERISLGRAVSDLALAGLAPPETRDLTRRHGFPQLPSPPGWVITDEMVARFRDDE